MTRESEMKAKGYQKVEYIQFHPSELVIHPSKFKDALPLTDSFDPKGYRHFSIDGECIRQLAEALNLDPGSFADTHYSKKTDSLKTVNYPLDDLDIRVQENPQEFAFSQTVLAIYAKNEAQGVLHFYLHEKSEEEGKDKWESWNKYTYNGSFTLCWSTEA